MNFKITSYRLILVLSSLFVIFYNFAFFKNFFLVYNFSGINILYTLSIFISFIAFVAFVLNLLTFKLIFKSFLILVLMLSSSVAYFMDTYNIVVDHNMIRNSLETNLNESLDLMSYQLFIYIFLLGILPSILVYKLNISYGTFKQESIKKIKTLILLLILILINIFAFSKFYTSFLREHKDLKYHANPTFWMFGILDYTKRTFFDGKMELKSVGKDAKIDESAEEATEKKSW